MSLPSKGSPLSQNPILLSLGNVSSADATTGFRYQQVPYESKSDDYEVTIQPERAEKNKRERKIRGITTAIENRHSHKYVVVLQAKE